MLHFVLFGAATDKVLLRLPNVIHDSSQFTVANKLCQTLTLWHLCEVKLHTGFLLSWICFGKFQKKLFKHFQALGNGNIYIFDHTEKSWQTLLWIAVVSPPSFCCPSYCLGIRIWNLAGGCSLFYKIVMKSITLSELKKFWASVMKAGGRVESAEKRNLSISGSSGGKQGGKGYDQRKS